MVSCNFGVKLPYNQGDAVLSLCFMANTPPTLIVCIEIGSLFLMKRKYDVIPRGWLAAKKMLPSGELTGLPRHPTKKVNKAE
jgi:hypothetical protein